MCKAARGERQYCAWILGQINQCLVKAGCSRWRYSFPPFSNKALLMPAMFSQPRESKHLVNLRVSVFILLRGKVELPAVTDTLTSTEEATKSALVQPCIFQEGESLTKLSPSFLFSLRRNPLSVCVLCGQVGPELLLRNNWVTGGFWPSYIHWTRYIWHWKPREDTEMLTYLESSQKPMEQPIRLLTVKQHQYGTIYHKTLTCYW